MASPTGLSSGQPVKDSKHSPQLQNQGEIKSKATGFEHKATSSQYAQRVPVCRIDMRLRRKGAGLDIRRSDIQSWLRHLIDKLLKFSLLFLNGSNYTYSA